MSVNYTTCFNSVSTNPVAQSIAKPVSTWPVASGALNQSHQWTSSIPTENPSLSETFGTLVQAINPQLTDLQYDSVYSNNKIQKHFDQFFAGNELGNPTCLATHGSRFTNVDKTQPNTHNILEGRIKKQYDDFGFVFSRFSVQDFADSESEFSVWSESPSLKSLQSESNETKPHSQAPESFRLKFSINSKRRKKKLDEKRMKKYQTRGTKLKGLITPDKFNINVVNIYATKERQNAVQDSAMNANCMTYPNSGTCTTLFGNDPALVSSNDQLSGRLPFKTTTSYARLYQTLDPFQQTCLIKMVKRVEETLQKELQVALHYFNKEKCVEFLKTRRKIDKDQRTGKKTVREWILGLKNMHSKKVFPTQGPKNHKDSKKTKETAWKQKFYSTALNISDYATSVAELLPATVRDCQTRRREHISKRGSLNKTFDNVATLVCYFPVDMEFGFCFEVKVVANLHEADNEECFENTLNAIQDEADYSDQEMNGETLVNEKEDYKNPFNDPDNVLPLSSIDWNTMVEADSGLVGSKHLENTSKVVCSEAFKDTSRYSTSLFQVEETWPTSVI